MRRGVFALAAVLSLLLCLASLTVWLISYFAFAPIGQCWGTAWDPLRVGEHRAYSNGWNRRYWIAVNGSLYLVRDERTVDPAPLSKGVHYLQSGVAMLPRFRVRRTTWGFAYVNEIATRAEPDTGRRVTDTIQQFAFPAWLLPILFSILPARWLTALKRRRRVQRLGLCPACGYDLRASPERCPECGTRASIAASHIE